MAYFPMYINLEGKKVIVVGGGKAALRKINSLLYFGAKIAVIAPKVCDDIKAIKGINVHESNVALDILQNADIVVAATRRPEINAKIGTYCNDRGIMVNVADNKELSSFLFPGVIVRGDLVVGVTTGGIQADQEYDRQDASRGVRGAHKKDGSVHRACKCQHQEHGT